MLDVFSDFIQEEKALNELAEKIEFNANNQIDDPDLIQSYGARLQKFEEKGGYRYESEIKGVLAGLNFTEDFYDAQVSSLSGDRKSTRLNSSHVAISYAVFCLKKKRKRKYNIKIE